MFVSMITGYQMTAKPLKILYGSAECFQIIHSQSRGEVPLIKQKHINSSPAEPRYTLSLQTVLIQISWLLKKPTDLDLHCLPVSM